MRLSVLKEKWISLDKENDFINSDIVIKVYKFYISNGRK